MPVRVRTFNIAMVVLIFLIAWLKRMVERAQNPYLLAGMDLYPDVFVSLAFLVFLNVVYDLRRNASSVP